MTTEELEKELKKLKDFKKILRNRNYDTREEDQRVEERIKNTKEMIEKSKIDADIKRAEQFVSF